MNAASSRVSSSANPMILMARAVLQFEASKMTATLSEGRELGPMARRRAPASETRAVTVTAAIGRSARRRRYSVRPPSVTVNELGAKVRPAERSSSAMVSIAVEWSVLTPSSSVLVAVADTRACRSGVSTLLSKAVMVTRPELAVWPAGMVKVAPSCRQSSSVDGGTGAVATVIVVTAGEGAVKRAVTTLTPPFSEMTDGVRVRTTSGGSSSASAMV